MRGGTGVIGGRRWYSENLGTCPTSLALDQNPSFTMKDSPFISRCTILRCCSLLPSLQYASWRADNPSNGETAEFYIPAPCFCPRGPACSLFYTFDSFACFVVRAKNSQKVLSRRHCLLLLGHISSHFTLTRFSWTRVRECRFCNHHTLTVFQPTSEILGAKDSIYLRTIALR